MPVLICLSGLPGVGKSTIARRLAEETGALWLWLDQIETAMRRSHMQTKDLADGGYAAAQAMAAGALRQGYDVIADCVNPIALTRTAWRNVSREAHARHIDVELICSDRREHRCRVETRKVDLAGWQPPEWSAVMTREYERMPEAALCIDTSRTTVEQSVARLTAAIRNPEGD